MRGVLIEAFGESPRVADLPDPQCPDDGVVVRVAATGVCRSDWHAWQGHDPDVGLPHVPGHELAGTVVAVGRTVRRWRVGDLVTVPFVCACGRCSACRAGEHQVCEQQTQPGFTHWGSFAELVALRHADVNLVAVPDGMTPAVAASLGCRFATAYRALGVHARVEAGDAVAVHGCGGVGLSAVMIAAADGARVVAVDPSPAARAAACELGAVVTLDPTGLTPEEVAAAVVEAADGPVAASLDALGHPDTAVASVLGLRRRGRHVQVGLLLADHARTALPMDRIVAWELEVYGSHGMAAHEYPAMLARVAAGELDPARLLGRVVELDEAPAALAEVGTARHPRMTVVAP